MVEKSIEQKIDPNYREDTRRVFLEAFKAAILSDPQLHLLSLPFKRDTELGLPTWCPDLKKLNKCAQLNSYFVGIRDPKEESSIRAVTDLDFLSIQGVEVDKIDKVASAKYPPHLEERDRDKRKELLSQFHDETLRMAQAFYGTPIPEQYCRTLIADVARPRDGRKWSTEEMVAGYQAHFAEGPLKAHLNATEKALSGIYSSCAVQACSGRKFIATTKRRVGLAPANCEVSDVICVFRGAGVAHVLRRNVARAEGEATTFSFVGDCYLHGIMNSEVLDMLDKKEKELELREFIIT
jgi:hypothetical protein